MGKLRAADVPHNGVGSIDRAQTRKITQSMVPAMPARLGIADEYADRKHGCSSRPVLGGGELKSR